MKSKKLLCGIDVSKAKLDVFYNDKEGKTHSLKVDNTISGHTALIKKLGRSRTYIMEHTGKYCLAICIKLKKAKADVRVENPLVIKRFIQMNMERQKNDKSDARWIYYYGLEREATVWHMPSKEQFYCSQIIKAIDLYTRKLTMLSNHLSDSEQQPFLYKEVKTSLEGIKNNITIEIEKLEIQLDSILDKWQGKMKENLNTIPCLGKRVIAYLLTYTNGFTKITNHRQLIALAGLAPREYTSGTSVSGKKGICKMGNADLRKTLYMCSLCAIRHNRPCKEQYERLKAAGKPSKVALIAVCNKLLKQAFAIATKGVPFQEGYISTRPVINNIL